jgi:CBS-domain-containing membrane protein
MDKFLSKMRGGMAVPPRAPLRHVAISWLGGFFAVAAVALLTNISHAPLVLGSFGATCVLVFGFPEIPFRSRAM